MKKEPLQVQEGKTYYPKAKKARFNHRRVVRIIGNRVFFSNGSDSIYSCSMKQFLRVVTDQKPERKKNERKKNE